jgi:ribonuclease BN (tRNA processing enzyme)
VNLTVLGKSPAWQDAGGACSGYLVVDGGTCLLLDCGSGVFGKLRSQRDYVEVDAVVISHLHGDHILDLVPYASGLTYAPRHQPVPVDGWPGTDAPPRPRLIAPPGARDVFRRLCAAAGMREEHIENAFALEEYEPDATVEVGSLRASFHEVPHFTPTFAIDFKSANGGGRFTYGADCRPGKELIEIARDTDLLMVEATLPRPERSGDRGHMTPAEAGDHAKRAGAKRVVLTHISDELDEVWARDQGTKAFGQPVAMAREGAVYDV